MATTVSWINTLIIQIIVPYLINTSAADLGAKVSSGLSATSHAMLSCHFLGRVYLWTYLLTRLRLGLHHGA